ncbi:cysteine dioxygenase [Klebsiella michiganensis]|uniref:Cysteine dioxygenase n=1 Tax=Klebsiella michiganensis TaxID=1134687 RepID=A0A7H4PL93_9ENTR|nr:cysteine dioxygenase [Klebsiella michiganensis]
MTAPRVEKLRQFIQDLDALHREFTDEQPLLDAVALRLAALVKKDDWLPEEYTLPHPHHYQQYLLHADSGQRFFHCQLRLGAGAIDADSRSSGVGAPSHAAGARRRISATAWTSAASRWSAALLNAFPQAKWKKSLPATAIFTG